jgi:hypothetical protein
MREPAFLCNPNVETVDKVPALPIEGGLPMDNSVSNVDCFVENNLRYKKQANIASKSICLFT